MLTRDRRFPASGGLVKPRGFRGAPIEAVNNYSVGSEDELTRVLQNATIRPGTTVHLTEGFAFTRTLVIPSNTPALVINFGRNPFTVVEGIGYMIDCNAERCVFQDLTICSADDMVQDFTVFRFNTGADHCIVRGALVCATNFAEDNGGLRTRIHESSWLASTGGQWRNFSSQEGFDLVSDLATTATPITVVANTWTSLTNDGLGAMVSDQFLPFALDPPWDTSGGYFNFAQLEAGDFISFRIDFSMTPAVNNAKLEFRMLSSVLPGLDISTLLPTLSKGMAVAHDLALTSPFVLPVPGSDLGNLTPQVRCDKAATVVVDFFGARIQKLGA